MNTILANKRKLGSILQLVLSIVLLLLLLKLIDLQSFLKLILELKPVYYAIGLFLYFLAFNICAIRWKFILQASGELIPVFRLIAINLVGSFFSIFLPTAAGGDLARMYESSRQGVTGTKAISTVLLDRVVGLMSLVIISLLSLIIGYRFAGKQSIIFAVVGMSIFLVLAWSLFFNKKFIRHFVWIFRLPFIARWELRIRQLYKSLYELHDNPSLLLTALIISFIAQAIEVWSVIYMARALGIRSESVYFFIFIPLVWLVTMLPISFNGLGLREGAFIFFFSQIGVISTGAVALSLLVYSCRILAGVLGGCLFLQLSVADTFKKRVRGNQDLL